MANGGSTFSVLGADVAIKGDVEASADLHVDGRSKATSSAPRWCRAKSSRIDGAIPADTARLAGTVKGTITARELVILKSARIEGDVHYDALTIEQGAQVDGRFAPDAGKPKAAARRRRAGARARQGRRGSGSRWPAERIATKRPHPRGPAL